MARINIESDLESKYEFEKLAKMLGDADCARGKLVRFFRIAQERYGHGDPITVEELKEKELECMVTSGWAIPCPGGYRAKGEEKHFGWFRQKVEAGKAGGKASALSRLSSLAAASVPHSETNPPTPTLSLSLSLTKILKEELKGVAVATPDSSVSVSVKKARYHGKPADEREFIATYVKAYQGRYGPKTRPECLSDGKVVGIVREFLRNRPLDRACDLIQVYLQMDDAWFLKNHHDLVTFTQKINQVGLALQNGRDPSKPMTFLEYMREKNGTDGIQPPNRTTKAHLPQGGVPERAR